MRPFNTYARGLIKNPHFVVERAITQALTTGKIELHNPTPQRDFVYRDDHMFAYLKAIMHYPKCVGKTLNVATRKCHSIEQMANLVAESVGRARKSQVEVSFTAVPDRPHDIARLHGDNKLIKEVLDWSPRYSLEDGIDLAVGEWIQALEL